MTFYSSSDSEQCPLLHQDDNTERYYDSFSSVPRSPSKHSHSTVEEETRNNWEAVNSPSQTAQFSESAEGNGGKVLESLDTTLSSTPNNEEEISYYSLPGIVAPGEEIERGYEGSRRDWSRPYKSLLRYSKSKLSKPRQGVREWILVAFVGCLAALMAFIIDNSQAILFDVKYGFCSGDDSPQQKSPVGDCNAWHKWSSLSQSRPTASTALDISIYITLVLTLSTTACALTLLSRTKPSLQNPLTPFPSTSKPSNPPSIPAAGSGVRELKLLINNVPLPNHLTSKTMLLKATAMILSTSSGLSIGKEGPFVHLGAGVSAWVARVFSVQPGETRRLLLCAGAASGLAVAFGAPVSGVVFVLEEFSLSLKLLEPFGNRMPVLIDVHYTTDWSLLELPLFILLGALGGVLGALFIKSCRFWATTYRRIAVIKRYPLLDILLIALLTGGSSYWNQYTKLGDSELLSNLAATCNRTATSSPDLENCKSHEALSTLLPPLLIAFTIKGLLTIISFGLCVPAGIYVPSMALGALLGKTIGHIIEALSQILPLLACRTEKGISCINVNPEVYALIGAGATMCGVTRLPVTLTIILFELTGSLKYVGCFCIAILVAKWVADWIEEGNIYYIP
ncbi:hypothetical protein HYFRA_00013225 [Hymenoscyphus fraxineus]|uniref:Chloride channel protein n=1 Tax=Hymenoscyphus fraxineus TaxID=746836 RepID=A0A9N9PZS9_9HELO|nr:hypothetical protein HYFRA_00013225 [Hymenoscyphus fraxineus]